MATRKEKLAAIRKADIERDSEFDNIKDYLDPVYEKGLGTSGRIKTRERVGQYKRDREGARDMSGSKQNRGNQTETYNESDGSSNKFDKLESGPEVKSKRKQRSLDRETLKDFRREKRATKIAEKKGMSVSQAQDFMKNRKNRLNAAMGEFGKGLLGMEQDLGRIKDREYRKNDKGSRAEDYKPFANSTTRTKSTYYDKIIPKAGKPIKIDTLQSSANALQESTKDMKIKNNEVIKDTAKNIKKTVTPQNDSNVENNVDAGDQRPRLNSSNQSGGRDSIYKVPGQEGNDLDQWKDLGRAITTQGQRDFAKRSYGKLTDWWNSDGMTKGFGDTRRNKAGESVESYNNGNQFTSLQDNINKFTTKDSPMDKLDDRSSMQGNMMNAKGRR
tara:strand:- start:49 stop:1209 length:1161 start_codon:yes stop_codon:yes gene_type:complete